nr:S-layer homology domain-containing protein [Cohnella sp. CFH 77786]
MIIAAVAFAFMAAGFAGSAWAADQQKRELFEYFVEDSLDHWASADLADFIQADILAGYQEDGAVSIKPQGNVTRAEFVAILLRAADVPVQSGESKFTDVSEKDWFHDTVVTASSMNLIYGQKADVFAPNAKITRAEIAAILNRFFQATLAFDGQAKTFTDIEGHWAKADIEKISEAGVVAGYGNEFKPNKNATRAEAASMVRRALHQETKAAPAEQDLIQVVKDYNDKGNELMQALKFDELAALNNEKSVGFEQAFVLASVDSLKQALEQIQATGATFEIKVNGDANYQVKFASDRYAAVAVTGQTGEIIFAKDGQSHSEKVSSDETYLLRKIGGTWKIYGGETSYQDFIGMILNPDGASSEASAN